MIQLSVNVNKIALLRNSRGESLPNVAQAVRVLVAAGAHGITAHPRPDLRHITPADVELLGRLTRELKVELNLEGNPLLPPNGAYPGFMRLVELAQPTQCTLVPDNETQLTSNGGFNLSANARTLQPLVRALKKHTKRVSFFLDPLIEPLATAVEGQFTIAKQLGASRVELYTAGFARAFKEAFISPNENAGEPQAAAREVARAKFEAVFFRYSRSAEQIYNLRMGLNAGHDLDLQNVAKIRELRNLREVSIGHALINEALYQGLSATVGQYLVALNGTEHDSEESKARKR